MSASNVTTPDPNNWAADDTHPVNPALRGEEQPMSERETRRVTDEEARESLDMIIRNGGLPEPRKAAPGAGMHTANLLNYAAERLAEREQSKPGYSYLCPDKYTMKPCPFCASGKIHWIDRTAPDPFGKSDFSVRCNSCASEGPWAKSEAGAVQAWNRRLAEREQGEPSQPQSCLSAEVREALEWAERISRNADAKHHKTLRALLARAGQCDHAKRLERIAALKCDYTAPEVFARAVRDIADGKDAT